MHVLFILATKEILGLTHISLASCLWDIGKQNSPRCDADMNFIKNEIKMKNHPGASKNESGLVYLISMGKSIVTSGLSRRWSYMKKATYSVTKMYMYLVSSRLY